MRIFHYKKTTYGHKISNKPRAPMPFSDWLFIIGFGFFSLFALAIFLISKYNHIWKLNINITEQDGTWFLPVFSAIFGLVSICMLISRIKRAVLNSKLEKAEKIGNETSGKVVDFVRLSATKTVSTTTPISANLKTEINYLYNAVIEFVSEQGQTICFSDYTPLTKDQINHLLEVKTVKIKTYKNICVLNEDLSKIQVNPEQKDYVKEENKQTYKESKYLNSNNISLFSQRAVIITTIFYIASAIGAYCTLVIFVFDMLPILTIVIGVCLLLSIILCFYRFVKAYQSLQCLKKGEKIKATNFSLAYKLFIGAVITVSFLDNQGNEKTAKAIITKVDYARINEAKELYVLVYKNSAHPDLNEVEKHLLETK